jgi:hypothetical protein
VAQCLAARPLRWGWLVRVDEAFPLGLLPEAAALPRLGAGTPSEEGGDGAGAASCERGQEGSWMMAPGKRWRPAAWAEAARARRSHWVSSRTDETSTVASQWPALRSMCRTAWTTLSTTWGGWAGKTEQASVPGEGKFPPIAADAASASARTDARWSSESENQSNEKRRDHRFLTCHRHLLPWESPPATLLNA